VPDIGGDEEGTWSGEKPPLFSAEGLCGPALLLSDDAATTGEVSFPAPDGTRDSGTLLFWSRGLENWDLWGRGNNRNLWPTTHFFRTGGERGEVWFYKWNWYGKVTYLWLPGGTQGNKVVGNWPKFDQYQWTQIGLSWQEGEAGKKRLHFYLNGKLTSETSGVFPFNGFSLGGRYPLQPGGRRLFDELKIYDRALTASEVKRTYRLDAQPANRPVVSVPRLKKAPHVDGKMEPGEWAGAAAVTGMLDAKTGEVASEQSTVHLGYDQTYLYVAMMGEMTEPARRDPASVLETFLRTEITGRDDKVAADDTVEVILSPGYWNSGDHRTPGRWKEYRLLANAAGGYSACSYGLDGANPKWEAGWDFQSTVGADGWRFEARIRLDVFGPSGSVSGSRWGLQLGRIWKHLKNEHNVWAWGRRDRIGPDQKRMRPGEIGGTSVPYQPDSTRRLHMQDDPDSALATLGVLQFAADDTPVVRVERLGALNANEIDIRATLANSAATEQQARVRLFTDTNEFIHEETLSLPAGQTVAFGKSHSLTDFASSWLTFEVLTAEGGVLHRTEASFYLKQSFGVRVAHLPNYEKFLVQLDLGTMSDVPIDELRVDLLVWNPSGETVYENRGRRISAYSAIVEGATSDLGPGDYTLSVTIRRGETILAKDESDFTRKPKARWFDNRYGYEDAEWDKVPYPWTDMKVEDDSVHAWGREYRFGEKFLPEQIVTLGRPMLREPMRIVIRTAEGIAIDTSALDVKSEWTKTNRTRVEGTRTIDAGSFSLQNSFWAEYDGLVWSTLTLKPRQKIAITSMEIEIPLAKEFTDVIKAGSHHHTGLLKPEGFTGGLSTLWLGNGDGGIQFFPSGEPHVDDHRRAMRVENDEGAATLRMAMVNVTTEFETPYSFRLGFVATPVRPKTWRTPEYGAYRVQVGQGGGSCWFPKGLEAKPAADPGRKYGEILYVWTASVSTKPDASGTDDFADFGAEWMEDPFQRPRVGFDNVTVDPTLGSRSYRDYFVWRYRRYQDKYGLRGLYYDNPGGPVLDVRNVMKRFYNIITMNNREYAARDTDIGLASNGAYNMAFGGFATYQWNGENLNAVLGPNDTYLGILDPAKFRAEYMGHNWGWPARLLGQGRVRREAVEAHGGPEAVYDQVAGLALLHDSVTPFQEPSSILPGAMGSAGRRLHDAIERHRYYHWAFQFIPYWRQDIVALPNENMHASFFLAQPSKLAVVPNPWDAPARRLDAYFDEHLPERIRISNRSAFVRTAGRITIDALPPHKAILILYNNTDWKGELRLKPVWTKLGFDSPEGLQVENAVHRTGMRIEKAKNEKGEYVEKAVFFERPEEYAKIEDGELLFPMTKFNYRMIVISRGPGGRVDAD